MELSYVIHAARRYWKFVVACAVIGAIFGYTQLASPSWASRATLSINAGSDAAAGDTPDRHVATEIGVLTSEEFAVRVAKKLGKGTTARSLLADVTVNQQSGADLVDIVAHDASGDRARAIVTAYATTYANDVTDSGLRRRDEVARRYDARLAAARDELAGVDAQIEGALAQYDSARGGAAGPTIDQIKPDLASHTAVLLDQVTQLTNERARALLGASAVNSARIIERGTDPVLDGRSKIMVLGPFTFAALLGGGFLAVVMARVSPRVLDGEEAAELVGAPLFGRLPVDFGVGMTDAGRTVDIDDAVFLNELCARLESTSRSGPALTTLVVGTEHVAASSALARSLAATLEMRGISNFCADIDVRRLDEFAPTPSQPSLRGIGPGGASASETTNPSPSGRPTLVAKVVEVGAAFVREHGPAATLDTLSEGREVVIVAAGSLLEAPASAEFASLADLVILVVPTQIQTRRRLQIVAQQIAHRSGPVLVVDDGRDHRTTGGTGWAKRSRRTKSSQSEGSKAVVPAAVAATDDEHLSGAAPVQAVSRRGLG
ncbi:MAG: hypothetical protein ABJC79_07175 [Acidimicrobiia bacterium]